jgi:hypothetical protein
MSHILTLGARAARTGRERHSGRTAASRSEYRAPYIAVAHIAAPNPARSELDEVESSANYKLPLASIGAH